MSKNPPKKLPSSLANMTTVEEVHEYYQKIISCMPNNVYWLDKECITQGCNNNVLKLIGLKSINEFVGITYEEMGKIAGWTEGHAELYKHDDQDVMSTGIAKLNVEDPPIHKEDGSAVYYLSSRVPLFDDTNKKVIGVVGISVDITQQKELQEQLRKAKEAAEAASHAKSVFLANMSHDIRTPLTGIIGMANLLQEGEVSEEKKQYGRWLAESGEQLLSLLNNVLEVVSADNLSEQDMIAGWFDLRVCLQSLVQLEMPMIKLKNLKLNLEIDRNMPNIIYTDRNKLHRILLNLVSNAIKFTQKGTITLSVKATSKENEIWDLSVSVKDTGAGIATDHLNKIFERFYRISPSYKGTHSGHGVGLHIARQFSEALGGKLTVESEIGVGSLFQVNIPVKAKMDHKVENTSIQLPANSSQSRSAGEQDTPNILLVEDNPIALHMLETVAQKSQCRFMTATSGEEALALATSTDFDLIVTDIGLPGISGIEFTKQLRSSEKQRNKQPVSIVGLTAHARDEAEKDCLQAGMQQVFTKPVTIKILQQAIENIPSAKNNQVPASLSLGADLPATEDALFALHVFPLFDQDEGITNLGSEDILRELLHLMVNKELVAEKVKLQDAYTSHNWTAIESLAHKLKSSALYCGNIRLKMACQYLERSQKANLHVYQEKLYQQLLLVIDDTTIAIKKWLTPDT